MGLISKNDDWGETLENLINGSELNSRVLGGGTLPGTASLCCSKPRRKEIGVNDLPRYKRMKRIFQTHFSGESLKAKVFRGGALMGMGSFAEQAVRFGRNMLLTRMLAPEAFGLMAMVLSAATLIQVLVDVGAREAIVQNPKGSEEGHVVAAWWMTVGRALSIYSLVYVLAPFAARFYGHSELTALARIAILSIVFDGLMSPRAIVAQKEMKFGKVAAIDNGGSICGVLITVILSFYLRDVWALVIGFCSENAIRCILSFIICPFRPRIPSESGRVSRSAPIFKRHGRSDVSEFHLHSHGYFRAGKVVFFSGNRPVFHGRLPGADTRNLYCKDHDPNALSHLFSYSR